MRVIGEAERQYDLMVVDTPPTSVVADAVPLVTRAGGITWSRVSARPTRDGAGNLSNQLRNLNAPVLGIVVNALGSDSEAYGYGYAMATPPATARNQRSPRFLAPERSAHGN